MQKGYFSARKQTRREALILGAAATLAATGLGTPGVIFAATQVDQTPGETEGPYWLDSMPNRSDIRSNSSTKVVQQGFQTVIGISVVKLASGKVTAVSGAKVDLWHCNASGIYSGVRNLSGQNTVGQNFCRGYQLTSASGYASFTTIYPGWYHGRTEHIHMRIRLYSGTTVTYNFVTQLYSPDAFTTQIYQGAPYSARPSRDTLNAADSVYTGPSQGNGGKVASQSGADLLLTLSKTGSQVNASFNVVL